ncbi:hypothetical protein [Lysobacter silvisoli]|uniref:hypothetical protein n=1 Tax=Lysobacter silvisoli TaxID=2293254 RepID=UPI001314DDFC|nr:hypothetical protein [Lysobacter silvisoli]
MAASKSAAAGVLAALEQRLLPELQRRGFEAAPLDAQDRRDPGIRAAFPFGRHRRRTPQGYDQIEIQIDKRDGVGFRLNFASFPLDGIVHAAGPVAAEDMWVHYLPAYCTLYRRPLLRTWFAPQRPLWGGDAPDATVAVDEAVALLPEIDAYFVAGTIGAHLRRV